MVVAALSALALLSTDHRSIEVRPDVLDEFERQRSDIVSIVRAMGVADIDTGTAVSARPTGRLGYVVVPMSQWIANGGEERFVALAKSHGWKPYVNGSLCRNSTRIEPNSRFKGAPNDRTYVLVSAAVDRHKC